MSRITILLTLFALPLSANAQNINIVQENDDLDYLVDWDFQTDGTIIIKQAHDDETFIFWAHEDGQPNVLAEINVIEKALTLTSGTIKVQVSKEGGPGATDIGAITFDTEQITSIIEGIEITGDLFTDAASTVDHVTGPILVGGSLEKTLTVLNDLEGRIDLEGDLVSGADIVIGGDMTKPIFLDDLHGNVLVTGSLLDGGLVYCEGTLTGSIDISGHPGANPIHFGDFSGATLRVRRAGTTVPGNHADLVMRVSTWGFTPFLFTFAAPQPSFYGSPTTPFGGGDPADPDFTFDITITRPDPEDSLVAKIVLNDPGSPTGQFDLRVPMDLASLTLAPELLEDPYPYLHNLYVAGDLNTGV